MDNVLFVGKCASAGNQRALVAAFLREHGEATTLQLREQGVMSPASRVMELRRRGWGIALTWRFGVDQSGIVHRTGVYVLQGEVTKC